MFAYNPDNKDVKFIKQENLLEARKIYNNEIKSKLKILPIQHLILSIQSYIGYTTDDNEIEQLTTELKLLKLKHAFDTNNENLDNIIKSCFGLKVVILRSNQIYENNWRLIMFHYNDEIYCTVIGNYLMKIVKLNDLIKWNSIPVITIKSKSDLLNDCIDKIQLYFENKLNVLQIEKLRDTLKEFIKINITDDFHRIIDILVKLIA